MTQTTEYVTNETTNPLVSVIVPAYNAAEFIARALESIATQTYRPIEIIVVDDGSTDDTSAVVEKLDIENLTLVHQQNQGVSQARNTGIAHATGELLSFLDADDEWAPKKLERQVPVILADDNVTLVCCDLVRWSRDKKLSPNLFSIDPPAEGENAWQTILSDNFLATPCVLTRTSLVRELGGFDPELVVAEDLDLWIRLALRGSVAAVRGEPLVTLHKLPNSLCMRETESAHDYRLPMIERHVKENAHRLKPSAARMIIGRQCYLTAENHYSQGHYKTSLKLFLKSLRKGYRPLYSLISATQATLAAFRAALTQSNRRTPSP